MSVDDDFRESLKRRLSPYTMRDHLLMQDYTDRGLPFDVAQQIARLYGPVNAASPAIMAAGLTRVSSRELFYVLLRNLWEECGDGKIVDSHVEMFAMFQRAVGVEPCYDLKRDSRGAALVDTYMQACRFESEHKVLALFHGFEAVFAPICGLINQAIVRSQAMWYPLAMFFSHHAIHDVKHAHTTREAMVAVADTQAKRRECGYMAEKGAKLIYDIFDEALTRQEEGYAYIK